MTDDALDDYHYHEAMDRCWMLMDAFGSYVVKHQAVEQNEEIAALAEAAMDAMMKVYQAIGEIHFKDDK